MLVPMRLSPNRVKNSAIKKTPYQSFQNRYMFISMTVYFCNYNCAEFLKSSEQPPYRSAE